MENGNSREIIGFDTFGEFPDTSHLESDREFLDSWNRDFKDEFLTREDLQNSFKYKGFNNIDLMKGDIKYTLSQYVNENKSLKIYLLHIDTDVYVPCKVALELLYDKVVPSGLIVFDDYSVVEGETMAVDEFFADKKYSLHKFSFSHGKPVYMKKDKGNFKYLMEYNFGCDVIS